MFWRQRVSTGPTALRRRSVLADIARAMVDARQLSVRHDAHYRTEDDDTWRDLLSSGILTEVGTAGQRVAFTHNILFDFAVSFLLIEDEPAQVAAFLAAEPARPCFFEAEHQLLLYSPLVRGPEHILECGLVPVD